MSRRTRVVAACAAVVLQVAVLYVPSAPAVPTGGVPLDKLVHVLVFALPTYALVRAGMGRGLVVVLMVAQALVSELVQAVALADRSGDVADLLADLVGVGIAVAVLRRRSPRASPRWDDPSHRAAPS